MASTRWTCFCGSSVSGPKSARSWARWIAERQGLSLRSFLGGSDERRTVPLSFTLLGHDPAAVRDEIAEARAAGFEHFNFKAAVAPETDIAVARGA